MIKEFDKATTQKKTVTKTSLLPGNIVEFEYKKEQRTAVVLNPNWKKKMHALTLENVSIVLYRKLYNDIISLDPEQFYNKNKTLLNDSYRIFDMSKIRGLKLVTIDF